ncbi:WYL domain-containing protein [Elizabethkingia meningoseptica]|uniref:helix-turn-helix transcriptional regulator n=1 Tax=Elizabethkingia meningoseptica TaxID=238 RepID=UPI0022F18D1C|nr:WYL domain-containing protein [Elizabethkingia meningoseptica]EJK5330436.1 WYL domain-containing protein [Elizabethkingia meningoseptica]MDE5469597.1 WYL domain-containing protein [Elizabethkingia meningoseptica]MDE5476516.1 WYL domain-containing protein [Elizabethkingia meningoseptica]MDE5479771.1 WYL domain-containing protein [Elizabethkingia meningoseptica]MDE5486834.1 WYL domain-containing protein [Elizabethkingia meningoseptica]
MSSNKNALIRYKTLDKCLRNKYRKYTLEDLIDECSEALFEYEGKESYVSKRTIQLDLQNMRSEKFGYEAPIEVYERRYYRYSDPEYSIHNISVNESDLKAMNNAIQILKQFKDFSMFREMNGVLQKLEDSVNAVQQKSIIHLDKNEQLRGLEHIDILYQAILNKKVLSILYKSFTARDFSTFTVHPQLLKEFNNRWFLICLYKGSMYNLALDRMESIEIDEKKVYIDRELDGDEYFKDVVGVTVSDSMHSRNVVFFVDKSNAPYVKTKPLHSSQEVVEEKEDGTVFKIKVQLNYELERLLLGFGESLVLYQPLRLRKRMEHKLKSAVKNYYETELPE